MNNAHSYSKLTDIFIIHSSDQEQEWQFRGTSFIKSQKSIKQGPTSKKSKHYNINRQSDSQSIQKLKSSSMFVSNKGHQTKKQHSIGVKVKQNRSKKNIGTGVNRTDNNRTKTKKTVIHSKIGNKEQLNKTINSYINSQDSLSITSHQDKSITSHKNKQKSKKNNSKRRSISRDYLMVEGNFYECNNIQEINHKIIVGDSDLLNPDRFYKATFRSISKLNKYLKGFTQFVLSKPNQSNKKLSQLSSTQRCELYQKLKKQMSVKNKKQDILDKLLKQTIKQIDTRVYEAIKLYPLNKNSIIRWKNKKLHQLMAIHTYFTQKLHNFSVAEVQEQIYEILDDDSEMLQCQTLNRQAQFDRLSCDNEQYKQQSVSFSELQYNNPQSEQYIQSFTKLRPILSKKQKDTYYQYQIQEKYPQYKQKQDHHQDFWLHQTHIFSEKGIIRFLQTFWDFMVDQHHVQNLLHNLHKVYIPPNSYHTTQLQLQKLIPETVFISYCKMSLQNNFYSEEYEQMCQTDENYPNYLVIFMKMLFDNCQLILSKFQMDYPLGKIGPLSLENTLSSYLINQQNVMSVWNEVIDQTISVHSQHLTNQTKISKKCLQNWIQEYVHHQKIQSCSLHEETILTLCQSIQTILWQQTLRDILPLI